MLLNLGIISSYYTSNTGSNTYHVIVYNLEYVKFRDMVGFVQSKKFSKSFLLKEESRNYFIDTESKILWLRVKSIEQSTADVYDFTVPGSHSFVSNGFISHNTVTGRMSSENPNFQQIPRKTENPLLFQYHNEPKALFVSRFGDDGCIMNADYCLAPDTMIQLINGEQDNIKSICERVTYGEQVYTYSMNPKTEEIVVSRIVAGRMTRVNEPTVKITLDNGESVICSYNHKFLLRDGEYVEAQHIFPGADELMSYKGSPETLATFPHTVSIIEKWKNMDLYDIEVENNHNFPLAAGIMVSNSALEMRVAAVISGDKKMAQAFLDGVDIHKSNASYVYNVPIDEVTKEQRTTAKSLE